MQYFLVEIFLSPDRPGSTRLFGRNFSKSRTPRSRVPRTRTSPETTPRGPGLRKISTKKNWRHFFLTPKFWRHFFLTPILDLEKFHQKKFFLVEIFLSPGPRGGTRPRIDSDPGRSGLRKISQKNFGVTFFLTPKFWRHFFLTPILDLEKFRAKKFFSLERNFARANGVRNGSDPEESGLVKFSKKKF